MSCYFCIFLPGMRHKNGHVWPILSERSSLVEIEGERQMKIKRLGRTGLKVSEICLGTMTFGNQCDEPTSHAIMDKALSYGVTFFDTADAYPLGGTLDIVGRTEEYIGSWLKGKREQIVLATKFFGQMGSGPNDRP